MQDIHSVTGGGGGGRLFTGVGGGGGDRRLRPHHHHGNGPQALKCPRCESLNTKFCYYNNYNLSQPRHFCKSCRRYWTKGGVLRNVPVGGGCRKTKRSKPKSGSNKNPTSSDNNKKSSTSQNSSSESSSLTATTTAAVVNPTTTAVPVTPVSSSSTMMNFPETSTGFFTNPSFEAPPVENNNLFTELGSFTGLINSTQQLPVEFNNSTGISPFRLHQTGSNVENSPVNQNQWNNIQTDHIIEEELKLPETGSLGFAGLVEKTGVGIGTEDWNNNGCTDQALFDLTGAVDQSYWSQTWDDQDHHHHHQLNYLP